MRNIPTLIILFNMMFGVARFHLSRHVIPIHPHLLAKRVNTLLHGIPHSMGRKEARCLAVVYSILGNAMSKAITWRLLKTPRDVGSPFLGAYITSLPFLHLKPCTSLHVLTSTGKTDSSSDENEMGRICSVNEYIPQYGVNHNLLLQIIV